MAGTGRRNMLKKPRMTMELKLRVFKRDHWRCRHCGRPVVFHPTLRLLQVFVEEYGFENVGYYHQTWANAYAPLLDHLGAVVDHTHPQSKGGLNTIGNLITSCNKCNVTRGAGKILPVPKLVKGKYGDPITWDGLSSLFIVLANRDPVHVKKQERKWLHAMIHVRLDAQGRARRPRERLT
jgi:hypothetical protein